MANMFSSTPTRIDIHIVGCDINKSDIMGCCSGSWIYPISTHTERGAQENVFWLFEDGRDFDIQLKRSDPQKLRQGTDKLWNSIIEMVMVYYRRACGVRRMGMTRAGDVKENLVSKYFCPHVLRGRLHGKTYAYIVCLLVPFCGP